MFEMFSTFSFCMLMNTLVFIELAALWTTQANYVDFDVVAWLEHHFKWLNSTIIESNNTPSSTLLLRYTENFIPFFSVCYTEWILFFLRSLHFIRLWLWCLRTQRIYCRAHDTQRHFNTANWKYSLIKQATTKFSLSFSLTHIQTLHM